MMFIKKMPTQFYRATGKFEVLNPLDFPKKQASKQDETETGAIEQQEHAKACVPQEPLPDLTILYALAKI